MKHWTLACLATAALIGCTTSDENTLSQPAGEEPAGDKLPGALVYEDKLSETAVFSVYSDKDGYTAAIESHLDRDKEILPVLQEAMGKASLEETYRTLGAIKPRGGSLPSVLAELDRQDLTAKAEREAKASVTPEADLAGPGPGIGPVQALAKAAATEPAWDWDGDVTWFKNLVRTDSPLEHEYFATMVTWAWAQRNGFVHTGAGLAASHIAKARFRSWRESCDLFGCSWETGVNKLMEPRTVYIVRHNNNASQGHILRKFQMDGQDPSKLVHLGVMWNTTKSHAPSKADVSVSINSFTGDNLNWTVRNNGSTDIIRPVVRITLSPNVPPTVLTETLNVTLKPGQTFTRNTYVPSPMFYAEVYVDPGNAIREFNELNNIATRQEN